MQYRIDKYIGFSNYTSIFYFKNTTIQSPLYHCSVRGYKNEIFLKYDNCNYYCLCYVS